MRTRTRSTSRPLAAAALLLACGGLVATTLTTADAGPQRPQNLPSRLEKPCPKMAGGDCKFSIQEVNYTADLKGDGKNRNYSVAVCGYIGAGGGFSTKTSTPFVDFTPDVEVNVNWQEKICDAPRYDREVWEENLNVTNLRQEQFQKTFSVTPGCKLVVTANYDGVNAKQSCPEKNKGEKDVRKPTKGPM